MTSRPFLAIVLAVMWLTPPAHAQTPWGMKACAFTAQSADASPRGLAVRDGPDAASRVVGYIAATVEVYQGDDKTYRSTDFQVVGVKDGWFRIEGATYADAEGKPASTTDGWVDGRFLTARLYRDTLKALPESAAADVVYIRGYNAEGARLYAPLSVPVAQVFNCAGRWFEVEIRMPGGKTLAGEPATTNGLVRGWTDRACALTPLRDDCETPQFDYPWSPLRAGITECHFYAFSKDRDPEGLNVRAAPDVNARVLGVLPPPRGDDTMSMFGATVIGYKKGWLLIEDEFEAVWDDRRPKHPLYQGRGWVSASLMTAQLLRGKLSQAPDHGSPDILDLRNAGEPQDSDTVTPRRIVSCSGDWVHVEVRRPPIGKTPGGAGVASGWANGTCASQTTVCEAANGHPLLESPPAPVPAE